MLQRDRFMKKGNDIRRLLERRLSLWNEEKFDVLLQEAVRCNRALKHRNKPHDSAHVDKIFTRLMMQGRIQAAMRWITDRSNTRLLVPTDEIEVKGVNGFVGKKSVVEVLRSKHPDSHPPYSLSLLAVDKFPHFDEPEITGDLIHKTVFGIQGGTGPGGCDASH